MDSRIRTLATAALAAAAFALMAFVLAPAYGPESSSAQVADSSITLTKDEIIGDNQPAGDSVSVGIPDVNNVDIAISGSGAVTLTIAGPAACDPRWTSPADNFPAIIGGLQTSVVIIPGASPPGLTASYSVTCPAGSPLSVNITARLAPAPGEDATNNMDENWVQVVVPCDADGDGVCVPLDNCPSIVNPTQANTDGDNAGDACDQDDDGDGWEDTVEQFTGTSPVKQCASTTKAHDETPDSEPSDFNDDRATTISDVLSYAPTMNKADPDPAYSARHDLDMNGSTTLADVVLIGPRYNTRCTP